MPGSAYPPRRDLPSVQSNIFSGCDSSLEMVPQADGASLGFRNAEAMPPYHYVYRDGMMYGPISERIEIPHVRRHYVRKKTTSTASSSTPAAPPSRGAGESRSTGRSRKRARREFGQIGIADGLTT